MVLDKNGNCIYHGHAFLLASDFFEYLWLYLFNNDAFQMLT